MKKLSLSAQKSRHFRLNRGCPSMSIQSHNSCCADYSLFFREKYNKIPLVRQAKPGEYTIILQF